MKMMSMKSFLLSAAMLSLAACATPQMNKVDEQESAGLNAFAACDFQTAETIFADLTVEHPLNPYFHLNLGAARHSLGATDLAVDSYMKAIELGESATIQMKIESDTCNAAAPASNMDATVTTTVAALARDNMERLLKSN